MEEAAAHFRQLDERYVSSGRSGVVHSRDIRCHATRLVAPIPGVDEAIRLSARDVTIDRLAEKCLDGCQRGAAGLLLSHRSPSRNGGGGQVSFLGASTGASQRTRPARNRLG